jgi:tyrosine phenol-lyase
MAGGQPVSMANIAAVSALCQQHGIKVMLDATRAVENAYFIKQREPGYGSRSIEEILREICSHTDGCTNSAKKDCLVNIGGFLCLNDDALAEEARNMVVLFEGLHTYGGLAGRDMEAMAIGIGESVQFDHIRARVGQVEYLGGCCDAAGVPIVKPVGGHGVFIDALRFLPHMPREQFPAQALAGGAVRGIGGSGDGARRGVRGTRPRHGPEHLPQARARAPDDPAARVHAGAHGCDRRERDLAHEEPERVVGLRFTYEPKYLRFFQARFEPGAACEQCMAAVALQVLSGARRRPLSRRRRASRSCRGSRARCRCRQSRGSCCA